MIFYRTKTKDYHAEIRRYNRLLKVFPDNSSVLKRRADCRFEKAEWKKAAKDYARIMELQPENGEILFKFGQTCVNGKMPESAVEAFTRVIKADPEFESGYKYRARAYRQLKQWDAAVADYTKAVELENKYRGSVDSLRHRGQFYLEIGEYEKAADDFSLAIGKSPYWIELYDLRGQAYMKMKLYEKVVENDGAVILFDDVVGTERSMHLNRRAIAYMKLGQTEKAKTGFIRAKRVTEKEQKEAEKVRKSNEEIIARKDRYFEERINKYTWTIRECTEAIKADRNNAKAYSKRAQCFYGLGYDIKSLRDCNRAISLDPKMADAYETRVDIYSLLGDTEKEIADFEMFREIVPDEIWKLSEPFDSYMETGRYEKALEIDTWRVFNNYTIHLPHFIRQMRGRSLAFIPKIQKLTTAISKEPENAALYLLRGKTYDENYHVENAIADYTRAIDLRPDLLTAYYYRAMANEDLLNSDTKNAAEFQEKIIADLSKIITLKDTIPFFHEKLGRVFRMAGRYDSALACFDKVLAMHPCHYGVHIERAATFEAMEDYQAAVAVMNLCINSIPNSENSSFFIRRGNLFYKTGETGKALEDYNKAMECGLNPLSFLSDFMEKRGKCYQDLGEEAKAKADFEKAVELRKYGW